MSMKKIFSAIAVLATILITSLCFAVTPTLTDPVLKSVGSNIATLILRSSEVGTGYFTLLPGSSANCVSGSKVAFGPYSSGSYHGSRALFANVSGSYTVRNLTGNAAYTACFTADSPSGEDLNQSPVSANLTTGAVTPLTGLDWRTAGSAGFSSGTASYVSMAFAPDGTPHVAFSDESDNGKAKVMKYGDGFWSLVGADGFSAGRADYTSLAFSPDGAPHVAYGDDSLADAEKGKATVMRYNGTAWVLVGTAGFSAAPASSLSLTFAPDGTPHVAFSGDDYNTNRQPVVMKFSGVWSMAGGTAVSSANARYTSMTFAPNGTLYVAYADDGASGKVSVKKLNGTSWESVGFPGFSVYDTAYVSLAISPDGTPHVTYSDYGLGGMALVKKYTGTAWEAVGSEVSTGQANFISLAFTPDGKPVVVYVDAGSTGEVTAKQYSSQWSLLGSADFSAGTANFTSLAIAPNGIPYVAYGDDGSGSRSTVMKLAGLPPTISGTPAATATVGMDYSFTPTSTDAASFSIASKPSWAIFDTASGALTGTPTASGTYSDITITAHNSYGSALLGPFSITVSPASGSYSVKISNLSTYPTIDAALTAAAANDTLNVLATINPEAVNLTFDKIITLEGGYYIENVAWISNPVLFSTVSSLTITGGTLIIDRIVVQ